jgi:hypothetical protein
MQFWVLDDVGLGPDHDRWWGLLLSKRAASFGEENWWEVFRGNRPPPLEPAPFRMSEGRSRSEQGDVMYTDLLGISFSARLADLLISIGCTGFSPNPSIIYDRPDRKVVCTDGKWTQFQRGSGEPDWERGYSGRPYSRRDRVGLFFDHSTWTGLDMFKPVKSAQVVITDRIAQAIQDAGLRGYHLVRTEEYGKDMVDALNQVCGPPRGAAPYEAPSLADLEAAAPYFRLISRPDPQARPQYDGLADAVVWIDEGAPVPMNLMWCLWRCRTCKIIGVPIEHEALWNRAMELFPEWIGFLPERTASSPENVEVYRRAAAALRPQRPE